MLDETKDKPPTLERMRDIADDAIERSMLGGLKGSTYLGFLEFSEWTRTFFYLEHGAQVFFIVIVDPREEPITDLTRVSDEDINFLFPFLPYSKPGGPWPPTPVEKKLGRGER